MPIAMFQGPMDQSPSKVFSNLRNALRTLTIKSKIQKHNSLCVLRTTNPDFHFFHSTNNYIFIELAQYNVAFFYFYKQEFATAAEATKLAQEIVQKEYSATRT
jgi:phosphoenolpyruvate carboxylase